MKTGNVLIGAVKSSFKPGDKVIISKKNIYSTARTGTVLRSIYPGKELVKTSKGMFYMDPKDLTKRSTKIGATNRFAGRPEIKYRVVWTDKKDKKFSGAEYHKTLESAKKDKAEWIELGYDAKIVKGEFTNTYYGNVRNQI